MADDNSRVFRLKMGNRSFGCRHYDGCPKASHNHCDEFCASPTVTELVAAGIDPKKFRARSRA